MRIFRLQKLLLCLIATLFASAVGIAQTVALNGTVTDNANNKALDGVTITVKGTSKNTTTNTKGLFTITVPVGSTLVASYVGYTQQEIKVQNAADVEIHMIANTNSMDEVVVVGYGTKKRVNIQGAVSTIKAADIEDLPVANLGSALVNRVPGVNVSFASGKPGSTTDITIRSPTTFAGSLAGTTQPLYVIDGIIVNQTSNFSQSPNPEFFENLDASQIEDITFLKDASAAIYGAAGAKGVILITTKKGRAGKPKISYSGYLGTTTEAVQSKTLSAYEHAKMLNDGYALNNVALTSRFSQSDLDYLQTLPDRSWRDQLWKAGRVNRQVVNVSGGSDRVTFFAGGSYYNEKGNYGDITVDKYSLRTGVEAKIVDGLTFNVNVSSDFNHEERNTLKGANAETDDYTIRALYLTPKWVPVSINGLPTQFNGPNPPGNWSILGLFNSGNYTRTRSLGLSFNTSLDFKPKFIPGLTARVQFAKLDRNNLDKQYYPSYSVPQFAKKGQLGLFYTDSIVTPSTGIPTYTTITNNNQMSEGTTTTGSYQLIGTLSYSRTIGNHQFSALAGIDQSQANGRNIFLTKFQQLVQGVDEFWAFSNDPTSAASLTDIIRNPQAIQFAKRSFVSRADYSFKGKYFVEFTGRGDASSNFAPEHRWGFFPTVGAGWRISEEAFFRNNIRFVNNLKIRATYGLVGEDRVANKTYVNRFTQTTGYLFGSTYTNGLDPNLYPNPDATWEKARTFNLGFDIAVLHNKLNITADFYNRYSYDMFNTIDASTLPLTTGIPSAVKNYGKQLAWGSEFAVDYRTNISRDWTFNVNVNFGWSNSQVLQQYYNPLYFGLYGTNALSNIIGKDPRTYNSNNYGYIATGILRTQADVDALLAKNPNYTIGGSKPQVGYMNFQDVNGDGKIDDNDITLMFGKTTAITSGGITLGLTYKEFRFQTNLNFSIGGKRFFDTEARKVPTTTQNAPAFWADHWTPENPNAKYPRADAPLAKETSTFWAVNGTQSRINNAVLSYSVPKRITAKYKIPDVRVLVTGTNLWSLVNPLKYKDPYTSNFASYPTLRTLSVGLNASL